ncbi:zinc finger CCCH domain-containing protein 36-like isoform X2 [Ananas comosus]|uniref:Zinc finger CCCH domain-containing protein 36-like isoform X2 n=1 Tax=Ananas comosus TaxID=4615 RepID=A0A6P5FHK5_ANACO|nr:zinc finger CCCH domain-containing protein 36-like isoform X2 [Ananas comosus]
MARCAESEPGSPAEDEEEKDEAEVEEEVEEEEEDDEEEEMELEEEEEVEEEEVEEEGEEDGEGDMPYSVDGDDTRTKVESGGRPEELKLNSSAHERSGANPASVSQLVDDNGGNITACDPLVEMQAARRNEVPIEALRDTKSLNSPRRRRRSSSPGTPLENSTKKPAVICDFFARGWCIKGNSCTFLHQKELVITDSQSPKDVGGPCKKDGVADHTDSAQAERSKLSTDSTEGAERSKLPTGSAKEEETPKLSASFEPRDSLNAETSSEIDHQRALVLAYGGENHTLPHLSGEHHLHASKTVEEGFIAQDDSQSNRTSTFPRNQLGRPQMIREEYQQPFGIKRTYLGYINHHASGWGKEPLSFSNQQGHYSIYDSRSSYSSSKLLNPTIDYSLNPLTGSPSSNRGSTPSSLEHINGGGKYDSWSASLPRSSSPFFSRSEVESSTHQKILREKRAEIQGNAWENSVPFRSSFCSLHLGKPAPQNQYDPFVDSLDPLKGGNISDNTGLSGNPTHGSNAQKATTVSGNPGHGFNAQKVSTDLSGNPNHGSNSQKATNALPPPHEELLDNKSSLELGGGHKSNPKDRKEKVSHVNEGANAKEANCDIKQVEKAKSDKESKALKVFRSALVDCVKELVKPFWREGRLSKDSHNTIVKKAVEKVLGAIQQVPTNTEAVNNYLSSSKPKLLKLVEGYVQKYGKS